MFETKSITFTPHHEHDCDHCTYLGSTKVGTDSYDFYIHIHKHRDINSASLIARYGVDGQYICNEYSDVHEGIMFNCLSLAKRLYLQAVGETL